MKKYILILLVLIIVLFTGCNNEKIDLNNDDDENEDINKNIDNDENEDNNYFGLKKDELESLATLSKINIDDKLETMLKDGKVISKVMEVIKNDL